jgi:hypothetical protein
MSNDAIGTNGAHRERLSLAGDKKVEPPGLGLFSRATTSKMDHDPPRATSDAVTLAVRASLFGLPCALAVLIATQRVRDCVGGAIPGHREQPVMTLLVFSGAALVCGVLAATVRSTDASPRAAPPAPVQWSRTVAALEACDLALEVGLSAVHPIMVLQFVGSVGSSPQYVALTTVLLTVGAAAGTWGAELVALMHRRPGERLPWTLVVPQLTTIVRGVHRMRGAARDGAFAIHDTDRTLEAARARVLVAFAAYTVTSWEVVIYLQRHLTCTRQQTWSSDGTLQLLDFCLLVLSGVACVASERHLATGASVGVAFGVLVAVYAVALVWLQTTAVV